MVSTGSITIDDSSESIHYMPEAPAGGWEMVQGPRNKGHRSTLPGDSAQFTLNAPNNVSDWQFAILSLVGKRHGSFNISIDRQIPVMITPDIEYIPIEREPVYTSDTLHGTHSVVMTNVGDVGTGRSVMTLDQILLNPVNAATTDKFSKSPAVAAGIVSSVVALPLMIFTFIYIRRRRRRQAAKDLVQDTNSLCTVEDVASQYGTPIKYAFPTTLSTTSAPSLDSPQTSVRWTAASSTRPPSVHIIDEVQAQEDALPPYQSDQPKGHFS